MAKILIVDDERVLVKGIKFNLEHEGYQVQDAYDGEEAVELAREGGFDLIILDVMMPKIDGLQACMRIREFSNVPIIMLTAKGEDTDKIIGFECGADDYLTKPFNILELKARVRALLRRAGAAQQQRSGNELAAGHIILNTGERTASRDGVSVELTAKEFDLMELLMRNPGRVYSRENLLNVVWGYEYIGDFRTVDVHIRRLREKLELDPANPEYIGPSGEWGTISAPVARAAWKTFEERRVEEMSKREEQGKQGEPSLEELGHGVGSPFWGELHSFLRESYGVSPTVEYSGCSLAPGWNVKYRARGRALCTIYPDTGTFTCMISIGQKEAPAMELALPGLTAYVREVYQNSRPSRMGRWLMIRVSGPEILEDIKTLLRIRMPVRGAGNKG